MAIDSRLVQIARQVYDLHRSRRPDILAVREPSGIVIHVETLRASPIYAQHPVLLPQESFIPLQQLALTAAS